jgi:NAD-dependent dihydropyrimidine dehydrogenase PreA subunit
MRSDKATPSGRPFSRPARQEGCGMAHVIVEPCIGSKDTACVKVCPVDCIHPTADEADFAAAPMLYIDPDTCCDCGLCVNECPVSAILPLDDLPEPQRKFAPINAAYYRKT